ncbi:MAG: NADH-quinone oxidoreductase subunit J, partial [Candidatus Korarchaeota archaeon]|nr:NADH-quinone oxidoreductase subunit J [Candidatus Korarchaeota archaeon]
MSLPIDLTSLAFLVTSALAVASAILVVSHKSLVYAAFFLDVLGTANAVFFALLGYPLVAVFQLTVYVGSAVTFILFSVVMLKEVPKTTVPIKEFAVFTVALTVVALLVAFQQFSGIFPQTQAIDMRELTRLVVDKYWFALLLSILSMATTLIEAITLA